MVVRFKFRDPAIGVAFGGWDSNLLDLVAIVSLSPNLKGIKFKQSRVLVANRSIIASRSGANMSGGTSTSSRSRAAQMPTYMLSTRQISVNRLAFGQMKEFKPKL